MYLGTSERQKLQMPFPCPYLLAAPLVPPPRAVKRECPTLPAWDCGSLSLRTSMDTLVTAGRLGDGVTLMVGVWGVLKCRKWCEGCLVLLSLCSLCSRWSCSWSWSCISCWWSRTRDVTAGSTMGLWGGLGNPCWSRRSLQSTAQPEQGSGGEKVTVNQDTHSEADCIILSHPGLNKHIRIQFNERGR